MSPMDDPNRTDDLMLTTSTNTIHIDLPNGIDGTLSKVPILVEVPKDLQPSHADDSTKFRYSPSELEPSLFEGINLEDFVDVVTTYKCKFCHFSCAWKSGLMSHLRTTHIEGLCHNNEEDSTEMKALTQGPTPIGTTDETISVPPMQEQQVFLCGQCKKGFVSLELCKEHMIKDHKSRKKHKKELRKRRASDFVEEKKQETEKRPAMNCTETLSKRKIRPPKSLSEDYYLSKTRSYVKRQETKERLFKCDVKSCNQQFCSEEKLSYHTKCHVTDLSEKCSFPFQCPECCSKTDNWRQMTNHLWKEHQVDMELYPCPDCPYRTSSSYKLEAHRLIHRDDRAFVCTKCNKSFKQLNQLRNHQVVHMDRKNLSETCWYGEKKCEECRRSFSDSKCLRKHMEAVHSKLRPYVCSFCGHTSARKAMLQLHLRQHTGEKPFQCDTCDYTTGDHNSLRRHKMRHTGLKPYKCPHCTYACIQASSFKTHIKNKHPGMEGLFCCELCTFRSVSKENFVTHSADHKREGNVSTVAAPPIPPPPPPITDDTEQQQPNEVIDIGPENLAAAQLIYSCLNAFSERGTIETIDSGKSQTITIHIPTDEGQRDGDQIYLTIEQPNVINVLNDSTMMNVGETTDSNVQPVFEQPVQNVEATQRTNETSNSNISFVTSNQMFDFCAAAANMPLLTTDTTS